mgnify:FL=1
MTVEEAIQKANAGDIETMIILGDYYGQNKDYDNALIWYRKAAELGDLTSMYKAFLIDGMTLFITDSASPDNDDYFQEINHYASILKNHPQFEIESNYSECKYAYAESLYYRNKYNDLFSLVQNESYPNFRIMYALVLFAFGRNSSSDAESEQYFLSACKTVHSVLQSDYVPEDHQREQVRFVQALVTYASVLRLGLNKSPNVPGSYQILAAQMDKLTNEDAKSFLSDQLSHYRVKKGIFGTSITYVD